MTEPVDSDEGSSGSAEPSRGSETSAIVVKKYANRRLYNTESSSYITLDTLAEMVRNGRDFVVFDAKSGDDITRSVLTQIIVEEESKGRAMLPTGFLRQLIGFYGDSMQSIVPRYLEQAMASFARQQDQVRRAMQQTLGPFNPFGSIEDLGRQNLAMMERAMSLFSPFYREGEAGGARMPNAVTGPDRAGEAREDPDGPPAEHPQAVSQLAEDQRVPALLAEIDHLRTELAKLQEERSPRVIAATRPVALRPVVTDVVADMVADAVTGTAHPTGDEANEVTERKPAPRTRSRTA